MEMVLYLEVNIVGIAMLLIIFFSYRLADIRPTEQKLFDRLLLAMVFVLMTDSIAWCANGAPFAGARAVNLVSNVLYFILTPLLCYYWYDYVRYRVGMPIVRRLGRFTPWMLPIAVNTIVSIASPLTGWYFALDAAGRYQRGSAFVLYTVIGFSYLILSVGTALRKAMRTDRVLNHPYYSLMIFTLLPLVGTALQTIFPWCYTTLICMVLALLIFYIDTLNQQIHTDPLTQLNNRRRMNEFLAQRLSSIPEGERLHAIVLDIDDFKRINDTYGHTVGDEALATAALLLKTICSDSRSFLARMGGDEFVILFQGAADSSPALILDDVQSAFADYSGRREQGYQLRVSAGCAYADATHPKRPEELIAEADAAMYQAKARRGRPIDG